MAFQANGASSGIQVLLFAAIDLLKPPAFASGSRGLLGKVSDGADQSNQSPAARQVETTRNSMKRKVAIVLKDVAR